MKRLFLFMVLLAHAMPGLAQNARPPPQLYITSDSAPGWLPTPELEALAVKAAQDYLAALDGGRYAEAYASQSGQINQNETVEQFSQRRQAFNTMAGAVKFHRVVRVTWTKDPPSAPVPGLYAAVDLVSQFANIDRNCGYLALYQKPTDGTFMIVRTEMNFINNETVQRIAATKSLAEVDRLWATLSARCPNYPRDAQSVR